MCEYKGGFTTKGSSSAGDLLVQQIRMRSMYQPGALGHGHTEVCRAREEEKKKVSR
jgi:hypothetical protein